MNYVWQCPNCGRQRVAPVMAIDDWPAGEVQPIGPQCVVCDCEMFFDNYAPLEPSESPGMED